MKKSKLLLLAFLMLTLTGCSLARAETPPEREDRWVGFLVVPSRGGRDAFCDNPYLEEYGTQEAVTEQFGTSTFPQAVLFAVEDEAGNYTFPGIETGFSLFYLEETTDEGNHCTRVVSNMGAHEDGFRITDRDEGSSISLGGTVYFGPPPGAADWEPYSDDTIWTFYRVYQTEDGRIYIDGGGNSANGPMSHTQTETRTVTKNGETAQEETLSVTAALKAVPRLERLVVTQFDMNNNALHAEDFPLQNDRTQLRCLTETAWLLVEEISAEGTQRTVCNVPEGEDPVSHDYVLLDDDGYGCLACLNIYSRHS